jgi:hypothetical protein
MARTKNRIVNIEKDGDFIDAQFVRENGEVVIGMYKRFGWRKAPKAVEDDVNQRLRRPTEAMTWPKPR